MTIEEAEKEIDSCLKLIALGNKKLFWRRLLHVANILLELKEAKNDAVKRLIERHRLALVIGCMVFNTDYESVCEDYERLYDGL